MTRVSTAGGALLMSLLLALSACDGSGTNPDPTGGQTTASPSEMADGLAALDEATAAQLIIARYDAVHGLPPTPPDQIDVDSAGDGVVAPGSTEAERVAGTLNQAIEFGVLDRGDVLVEALEPPAANGEDGATASLCMSQNIRATDLETGEPTGAPAPPDGWLPIEASYERIDGEWLLAMIQGTDPASACVPPSIASELSDVWGAFTDAWRAWGRQGGDVPDEVLELATERYAGILRDAGAIEPAEDEPDFAEFTATAATRTDATAQACLQDRAQTVEWMLVDGRWLIDIVRQEEASCS